jgi:hypothetical protein
MLTSLIIANNSVCALQRIWLHIDETAVDIGHLFDYILDGFLSTTGQTDQKETRRQNDFIL